MNDDGTGTTRVAVRGAEVSEIPSPDGVHLRTTLDSADLVLAVGESALLDSSVASRPVLPVDAGVGVRSVPEADLADALRAVQDGEYTTWSIPRLSIAVDGDHRTTALLDVMLVTDEAAHISEFSVRTPGDDIAQFRADGVLVSAGAGTSGYARRVDAPVMAPELPAAAVVPIAPFATTLDHWVVEICDDEPIVEATIEREESAVTLLADDRTVGPVPADTPITVTAPAEMSLVRVPQSRSCFQPPHGTPRDGGQS